MTDLPHPDGFSADELDLASAYVDGAVDPDERAHVEGSAGLLSLVADISHVRAALTAVTPIDTGRREDAIAAALAAAEFEATVDEPDAAAAVAPVRSIGSLPRRTRLLTMVSSAAAAVVLVVVAVIAFSSNSDDSDNVALFDTAAKEPTAEVSGDSTRTADPGAAVAGGGAPSNTIGAITSPATVLPEVDTPDELASYAATLPADTAPSTDAPPRTESSEPAATTFATPAPTQLAEPVSGLVPVPTCLAATDVVLGAVTVRGQPATVVRSADGRVRAVDASCATLLAAEP